MRLIRAIVFLLASGVIREATAADWTATDEMDSVLKTQSCRAATTVNKTNSPAEVVFAVPKDQNQLPVVYLKFTGLPSRAPLAKIRFAKNNFHPAYLMVAAQSPQEADVYWYAPKDLPKLLELIKGGSTLDVVFDPASTKPIPVRFSLGGSSAALKKVTTCLARKDLLPVEFLKALNQQLPAGGPGPDTVSVPEVLALANAAYVDYLSGKTEAEALAILRKAMKPLTDKEAKTLKLQSTKQAAVDATNASLQRNLNETSRLEADVARSTDELNAARGSLPSAESDLAAKKASYQSGKTALQSFESEVRRRSSVLEEASSAVQQTRNDISRFKSHLDDLESEASRLRHQISNLEGSLSSARSEEASARAAYNAYDERQEVESALRSHWRYSSLRQSLREKHHELRRAEGEAHDAHRRVSMAESALSSCRARGFNNRLVGSSGFAASSCDEAVRELNSAHANLQQATLVLSQVGRICGGAPACIVTAQNNYNNAVNAVQRAQAEKSRLCGATSPEPRPTPRPPPDCRREEENLRQAQYEENRIQSQISSLRSDAESMRNQIEAIEGEIRSAAAAKRADLQRRLDNAMERTSQITQDLESARGRLGAVTGSEIPSYEAALSEARARLPGLVDHEASAERELAQARRDLAEKRRQIGFDAIESAYVHARDLVNRITEQISELGARISNANTKIAKLRAQLAKLQTTLAKQKQELEAAITAVAAIQTQLGPQRQQESALVARLEAAKTALAAKRADYQARVQKLNSATPIPFMESIGDEFEN